MLGWIGEKIPEIWAKEGIMGVLGGREPEAKADVSHKIIKNPRATRELK